jgi:hypothetical protein
VSGRALILLLLLAAWAGAGEPFQASGNTELWAYGTAQDLAPDSPLNPGNQVARLTNPQWTGQARVNLRLARDSAEFVLRPRAVATHDLDQAYLGQAFARIRLDGHLTLTAGRELLTWGPGNFRSPSNPLYFDPGRTDPLRDVAGVDLARLTWTQGPATLMLAREQGAGHLDPAVTPERVTLGRLDLRGRSTQFSVIAAAPVWGAPFFGSFAQATLGEAWLVYGELGSGRRPQALTVDPALLGPPFLAQADSPRETTTLLGATYTAESGQTLGLEWVHDGHGFSAQGERQYFARAAFTANQYLAAPGAPLAPLQLAGLGQGLSQAPALLGRDYASLLWQSNLQETGHYWRLMWTGNLQDRGSQVLAYGEKSLSARFTAFAALNCDLGGVNTEFGSLSRASLTLGMKCFVF